MVSFVMSNTVSPGVSSILSLIVSRFSSGYFFRDVLSVEYMVLTNHVPPVGIFVVFIVKVLLATSASPNSFGLITFVLPNWLCFTINLILFVCIPVVVTFMVDVGFIAPWLSTISSGLFTTMPLIFTDSFGYAYRDW